MDSTAKTSERISVLIPAYNQEGIIENILKSIEKQNYHPMEVVIIDDCSKDGTFKKITEYAEQSKLNIRAIRNSKNLGVYGNADKLINSAKGDVICFIGGDDLFIDKCFKRLDDFLKTKNVNGYKKKFIAITNFIIEYPTKKKRKFNNYLLKKKNKFSHILKEDLGWRGFGVSIALAKSIGSRASFSDKLGYAADQIINLDEYTHADEVFFVNFSASVYKAGIGVSNDFSNDYYKTIINLNAIIKERYANYLSISDRRYLKFRDSAANFHLSKNLVNFIIMLFNYFININNFGRNNGFVVQAKFMLPRPLYLIAKKYFHILVR